MLDGDDTGNDVQGRRAESTWDIPLEDVWL